MSLLKRWLKEKSRELIPPGGSVSRRRTGEIPHGASVGPVTAVSITPEPGVTATEASAARRGSGLTSRGRRPADGVDGVSGVVDGVVGDRRTRETCWLTADSVDGGVIDGADDGGSIGLVDRSGFLGHLVEVLDVSHNLADNIR